MAFWGNIAGTVTGYFRLGLSGVRLKNDAGVLVVRNTGDTADAKVQVADGTAANHAVSKSQLDAKQPLDATLSAIADGTLGAFSHRNKVINGRFAVNQSGYVSGAAVDSELYGHDMWKMATAGDSYTYSTTANKTTVTIPAGKVLQQIIEGLNLQSGTYVLSWEGTAQGKIGAGSYGASGITGSITGGTNTTIEFGPGTVTEIQLETGTVPTAYEDRPYSTEERLCWRHYWKISPGAIAPFGNASAISTTMSRVIIHLPMEMRADPTALVHSGTASDYSVVYGSTATVCSSVPTMFVSSKYVVNIGFYVAAGLTAGAAGAGRAETVNGFLALSARL